MRPACTPSAVFSRCMQHGKVKHCSAAAADTAVACMHGRAKARGLQFNPMQPSKQCRGYRPARCMLTLARLASERSLSIFRVSDCWNVSSAAASLPRWTSGVVLVGWQGGAVMMVAAGKRRQMQPSPSVCVRASEDVLRFGPRLPAVLAPVIPANMPVPSSANTGATLLDRTKKAAAAAASLDVAGAAAEACAALLAVVAGTVPGRIAAVAEDPLRMLIGWRLLSIVPCGAVAAGDACKMRSVLGSTRSERGQLLAASVLLFWVQIYIGFERLI